MKNKLLSSSLLFLLPCLALSGGLPDWLGVSADVFDSNEEGALRPRLELKVTPSDVEGGDIPFPFGIAQPYGGLRSEINAVFGGGQETENSFLDLKGGVSFDLTKPSKSTQPLPIPDPDAVINEENGATPSGDIAFGVVQLDFNLRTESDQSLENLNIAGGVSGNYAPRGLNGRINPPWFGAAYEYVEPVEKEAREAMAADESWFPRFRFYVLWAPNVGGLLAPKSRHISRLDLNVHYRYFQEFDQPESWESAGFDSYDLLRVSLDYNVPPAKSQAMAKKIGVGIRSVYVGFADGRTIAHEKDDAQFLLGVKVW